MRGPTAGSAAGGTIGPGLAAALEDWFRRHGPCLIAFSGGVDSSLLLATAVRARGDEALAVTARSALRPEAETEAARALASDLGARHLVVDGREPDDPAVAANSPDRCYHCKRILLTALSRLAEREGLRTLVDGGNADDLGDYRPGNRAVAELGVSQPLIELGAGKAAVRAAARRLGLPNWNLPAAACLASRIPHGTPLTPQNLSQVGEAEAALQRLGFEHVRVRHHGDIARIEVPLPEQRRLLSLADAVARALRRAGFRFAALDLEGYRTGSLNPQAPGRPGEG